MRFILKQKKTKIETFAIFQMDSLIKLHFQLNSYY